jgi:hypothetical protein
MATTLATWTIDPVHLSVEFSLDYMGFSTYRTGFCALEGSPPWGRKRPRRATTSTTLLFSATSRTPGNGRRRSRSGWRIASSGTRTAARGGVRYDRKGV